MNPNLAIDLATTSLATFGSQATTVLGLVVAAAVLLISAGYAWRQFKGKVAGKKI